MLHTCDVLFFQLYVFFNTNSILANMPIELTLC